MKAVLDLALLAAERGHPTTIITQDSAEGATWAANSRAQGYPVDIVEIRPPSRVTGQFPADSEKAIAAVAAEADVVHLHSVWRREVPTILWLARRQGCATVLSTHGALDDWCMRQARWKKVPYLTMVAAPRLLRWVDVVHCTAEREARQASRHIRNTPLRVAPLPLDHQLFKNSVGPCAARDAFPILGSDRLKLLFFSRLDHKKRPDAFIRGVSELVRRGQPVHGILAGAGQHAYRERLGTLVADLGLQNDITMLDHVSGSLRLSLLAACDLTILPTQQENFALALVESLAMGTPIVTTDAVDIGDELVAMGDVRIIDAASVGLPTRIADAVEACLHGGIVARASTGRKSVLEWLDPDSVFRRYDSIYREARTLNAAAAPG